MLDVRQSSTYTQVVIKKLNLFPTYKFGDMARKFLPDCRKWSDYEGLLKHHACAFSVLLHMPVSLTLTYSDPRASPLGLFYWLFSIGLLLIFVYHFFDKLIGV